MTGNLIERSTLTPNDRERMYGLFNRFYDGVSRDQFESDLDDKRWVILLEETRDGSLRGFSTLDHYETHHGGERIGVVYSGDTIVDPGAGTLGSALSRTWIGAVNQLRDRAPKARLFWLLLVSGYRTYRFLPLYWREFFPRFDAPTPPRTQALIDDLAVQRFGPQYERSQGIIRFANGHVLCKDLCRVSPRRRTDPHVAFFFERNPGHARGDELVCLTELSRENLTAAGERMWRAGENEALTDGAA